MRFITHRIKHVGQIAHLWWVVIYGAWALLCSLDVFVEHYASESFKVTYNNLWEAPKWGWQIWIIGLLVITVFAIFEGSYQYALTVESRLAPKLKIPDIA